MCIVLSHCSEEGEGIVFTHTDTIVRAEGSGSWVQPHHRWPHCTFVWGLIHTLPTCALHWGRSFILNGMRTNKKKVHGGASTFIAVNCSTRAVGLHDYVTCVTISTQKWFGYEGFLSNTLMYNFSIKYSCFQAALRISTLTLLSLAKSRKTKQNLRILGGLVVTWKYLDTAQH